ncbi:MAG TPA: pseudouridine-5'-phosphate glycosidase [Anaerolineaceae bacterium]|nr:pseudouridine-5'-phosphate glycosidase [Anaerolineaceae bacterium]HPN51457.1 pseudouridine-5'-phosphate glycosidase [Anaerolineaceae bacterium]
MVINHPSELPKAIYSVSTDVTQALQLGHPLVALESAVITHGLPYPENLTLARDVESEVRANRAIPATIAIIKGKVKVGLELQEMESLACEGEARKISRRDYGIAIAGKMNGGTTVAGTLIAARQVGIKVFATGGIGGVHRNAPFDVSADLMELSQSPLVVVCAGAKAILDLPSTLEYLETMGVPVIGYQTDDFPAFYSTSSGLPVSYNASSPEQIARIATMQWKMGLRNAVLVANPPPPALALPRDVVEKYIEKALADAESQHITGSKVTPFLLRRVTELSGGASLRANLALLKSNARLAAEIAYQIYQLSIKTGEKEAGS